MLTKEELDKGFNLGDWEVLPAKGLMQRGDEEVHPEPRVLAVLLALAERDGNLVTKDELIEDVWDGRAFGDEPLLRCISVLRGHFGDKRPYEYIETLQRRGYRLLKPVELHTTAATPDEAPDLPQTDVRRWQAIAGIIAAGFVAIAAYMWVQSGAEPEPRSLAILQIENLTGDPGKDYVVDGIKNMLAQRLAGIPSFTIKNVHLQYQDIELSEIARRFKVEYLLSGDVQQQNGTYKVSYLITLGENGATTGGGEVSGPEDGLFDLQERLARAVRDDLAGPATQQLITQGEPDSAAYNSYMRGIFALELRFDGDNLEIATELFKESIKLDENYGPAYLALATAYSLTHDYYGEPYEEMLELALATIEKGVSVDPTIEDASWAIYGRKFHQEKEWSKAEAAYLRAIKADVVDSNAFSWYSRMLASTGRLEAARDIALEGEDLDPDNPMVNSRIAMAQTWLGDDAEAYKYFDRSNALGATGNLHIMSNALLLYRGGKANESKKLSLAATELTETPNYWVEPVYRALADPRMRDAALSAVNQAWDEQLIIPDIVLIVRTLLGDLDGAMEIAELLEDEGEAFSTEMIFVPEIAPLRRHPDFMPLLDRLGIVAYWNELGCTWDGDRVHCPMD
jgi:DNA-binding winged helix-turn-helix (wHTH) protein/tetratricopeptide (TPR) repeat protein